MKPNFAALPLIVLLLTAGCSSTPKPSCEEEAEVVVIADEPQNVKSMISLVNQNTGELACCRDNEYTTAEACAKALEKECYTRVEDIPYRNSKYDFLTTDTYPTRRWRDNETSPRW